MWDKGHIILLTAEPSFGVHVSYQFCSLLELRLSFFQCSVHVEDLMSSLLQLPLSLTVKPHRQTFTEQLVTLIIQVERSIKGKNCLFVFSGALVVWVDFKFQFDLYSLIWFLWGCVPSSCALRNRVYEGCFMYQTSEPPSVHTFDTSGLERGSEWLLKWNKLCSVGTYIRTGINHPFIAQSTRAAGDVPQCMQSLCVTVCVKVTSQNTAFVTSHMMGWQVQTRHTVNRHVY